MFPHPYFTHPHPAQHRRAGGFVTPSPAYPHAAQQFNFFSPQLSPPTPAYDYVSIDEEERAALAHLRSIQRRREEAEAAAAREAALAREASARVEREAAIRAELARIERQRQVAQAIRAQQQAEEDRRKRAYLEAIERKRNEIVSAQLAAQARRQAALVAAQARREEVEARRQKAIAYAEARRQAALTRGRCAQGRCQRRSAPTTSSAPTERNEWQDLNNIFGPLFGFNLVPDAIADTDNTPTTTGETTSQTRTASAESTTPSSARAASPTSAPAPAATPAAEKKDKREFPEDINNLLSQFLGLRVDPVSESDSSSSVDNAKDNGIPKGLNEFLGQFGLVFEPEATPEEKKAETPAPTATEPAQEKSAPIASSSTNVDRPATASTTEEKDNSTQKDVPPFTSLLEQFTDVNPFLRDLLGNFEHALTDELNKKNKPQDQACQGACERQCARSCEKKDKGKARAEGERKEVPKAAPTSTPAPVDTPTTVESTDSSSSITALDSIESQLDSLRSSFTFPSRLSFAHSTSESISPPLLFNKTNSAYHTQANSYLQLLLKADGITSNGDREIRKRRKELVSKVEREIENLEKQKDEIWKEVKAKRDNGEESEPDEVDERSWSGSETTSVAGDDHIQEHKEEVEVEHVEHKEDQEQEHEHKSYADVAKTHSEDVSNGQEDKFRAEPTSTTDQSTPISAADDQPENANDTSTEQPPKEETEGYTITVTFPTEDEPVQGESEEKKEVQDEEAEPTKEVSQQEPEQDKRSDKSARVETEEEEAKEEEGYELV